MVLVAWLFCAAFTGFAQSALQAPIIETVVLKRPAKDVFAMFTDSKHLEKWLVRKTNVSAVIWGKFELYWEDDMQFNEGCKILTIEKDRHLSFEVKGPAEFDETMNHVHPLTKVTIILNPIGKKQTSITLVHSGWRDSADWVKARNYFATTWQEAMARLSIYAEKKKSPSLL